MPDFVQPLLLRSLRHCPWHLLSQSGVSGTTAGPLYNGGRLWLNNQRLNTTSSPKAICCSQQHKQSRRNISRCILPIALVLHLARCTPSLALALRTRLGLTPRTRQAPAPPPPAPRSRLNKLDRHCSVGLPENNVRPESATRE